MIVVLSISVQDICAQAKSDTLSLTFDEVIKLSETQSTNALIAKQRFRSSYWQYRSFQAQYLPSLRFTGTAPDYSNRIQRQFDVRDSTYSYIQSNSISTSGQLALSQSIGFTGTTISLRSDLELEKDLEHNLPINYLASPISLYIQQPIKAYNSLKWEKKIEPLRYEQAKKTLLQAIEEVHLNAVMIFFNLASAQINMQIATTNLKNAKELYDIAVGRYGLGTIAQDDLYQMELRYLNGQTSLKTAEMNLRDREIRLRSFLGFNEQVRIKLILPVDIPDLQVDPDEVLQLAKDNNPDYLTYQINLLNAASSVAQAKANKGLNASLIASLGLNQQNQDFSLAYQDLNRTQTVRLSFSLPILDWGEGRGRLRMAQSNQELVNVQTRQAQIDFEQNLLLDIDQFNLQKNQVEIAAKSDTIAAKRYEVTRQRFLIGRVAVLDLNDADANKDSNRRMYVQAVQQYWNYFYNMRSLTLFDFINREPLETDYESLID